MPAVDLVLGAIGAMVKIKGVLEQFRRNNDECRMIYALVDTVSADLMLLKGAPIMEDESLRPVLERLKDTLEQTEAELRKCKTSNALVRFFRTDDIAAKLNQLRQDISEKILGLVLATSVSNHTLVDGIGRRMDKKFELLSQEMLYRIYAAVGALLLPLETKLERLEQRITNSTDNAGNKNRTETEKTGLLKYNWSVLQASLASNEDIGGGHISTVHKGELNKIPVAIKKFGNVINRRVRERFVDELRLISKLQHGNVIQLLGHCYEYTETLVQEGDYIRIDENGHLGFVSRYMPNQSLVRIIEGNQPVDWPGLFRIIQGIAKGVHYLHEKRVVHLNLKPKTILLDADMTPKINDFGTARELASGGDEITLDATDKPGTQGYMAPELSSSDKPRASTKCDVYSFGVILLETISLMCATSQKGRPRGPEEWLNRTQGTELRDLFDRRLVDDELLMVATRCVLVGLMCCLPDPAGRPSMHQVVDMLAASCVEAKKHSTNLPSSSSSTGAGSQALALVASSSHPLTHACNNTTMARNMKMELRYRVLTRDHIGARLKEDTRRVGELLSISPGVAAVLLRHCHWKPERVQNGWYENGEALRIAVGLPPSEEHVSGPKVLTTICLLCSDHRPARSAAGCCHYYCDECWRTCVLAAVHDGPQCLSLRCPDPLCEAPVVRELVAAVVHDADMVALYEHDQFALLSYVDDSGGRIKWCHGRGCSRAVEILDGDYRKPMDVVCECGHGFCWDCGKKPHQPVPCDEA